MFKMVGISGLVTVGLSIFIESSFLPVFGGWGGNCNFLFPLYLPLDLGKILLHWLVMLSEDSSGYGGGKDGGWCLSLASMVILESTVLEKSHCFCISISRASPKNLLCRNVSSPVPALVLPPLFNSKKEFHLNNMPMKDHSLGGR